MKPENFILVIEDSAHDYEVLRRAVEKTDHNVGIKHFEGGLQALDFLYQAPQDSTSGDHALPALIFLDLRMPEMDGFAFLETVKDDDTFKSIPIIILSVSENPEDITRSYEYGASGYFKKPLNKEDMDTMVESILQYWFSCSNLPAN